MKRQESFRGGSVFVADDMCTKIPRSHIEHPELSPVHEDGGGLDCEVIMHKQQVRNTIADCSLVFSVTASAATLQKTNAQEKFPTPYPYDELFPVIEKVVDANWNKDIEEKLALSKGAISSLDHG